MNDSTERTLPPREQQIGDTAYGVWKQRNKRTGLDIIIPHVRGVFVDLAKCEFPKHTTVGELRAPQLGGRFTIPKDDVKELVFGLPSDDEEILLMITLRDKSNPDPEAHWEFPKRITVKELNDNNRFTVPRETVEDFIQGKQNNNEILSLAITVARVEWHGGHEALDEILDKVKLKFG